MRGSLMGGPRNKSTCHVFRLFGSRPCLHPQIWVRSPPPVAGYLGYNAWSRLVDWMQRNLFCLLVFKVLCGIMHDS